MSSPSGEHGDKDTVVEKLLAIFPAMEREVARSVLITCEYDLAQTVETLKELGIHKLKESALKGERLARPGAVSPPSSPQRMSSGNIAIPGSPTRGTGSSSSGSPHSAARSHGSRGHAHSHARSPSTYTFGSSPVSNSYFADYDDAGITSVHGPSSALSPSFSRPPATSPNPYLPPTNPYLVPPGFTGGPGGSSSAQTFGGAASPSSRPSFYAYSYSSSPGSIYPISSQAPSFSSPSLGPGSAYPTRTNSFSAYNPAGPSSSSNPYTFSSSPRIPHPQQYPPASAIAASSSPNPFYNYSYSSSPGSVYPISSQPGGRNPFAPGSMSGSPGTSLGTSPGMPGYLSSSPGTQYFSSLGPRVGSPSTGGLNFRKEALRSSLDDRLRSKAIKIEDESEGEGESDSDSGQDDEGDISADEQESVGDNEVLFADEESLQDIRNSVTGSPSREKKEKKKPTIIILRPKQDKAAASHGGQHATSKRQMPNLALRKFMKLVFKNRSDISPLNPLAALFMCMSQVSELQQYFLSDAYKADLKPEKNKTGEPADLGISGDWDAQDVYHGSRRLTLAQHFAYCVKALEGKNHSELRELDEQFAAFQQIVTSRTPHLSGSGSVEEEAGRYSELADWLIDHLKEDLNVKSPDFEPTPEDEALGDDHVAAKYWESYKSLNPSLLSRLFTTLLKTAITCTGCGHRAVSVSLTNGLTLPTSLDKKRNIVITFVPDNVSSTAKPSKHTVSVFKTSYGQDLKLALIDQLNRPLRPDQIILTEIYNGHVAQFVDDSTPVDVLKDKDVVVAYEVPAAHQNAQARRRMSFPFDKTSSPMQGAKADSPIFLLHRFKQHKNELGADVVGKPFPVPRLLTYTQLYNIVWERFNESLGYSKELSYAELAEQIRESEEKRLSGEKDAKGREDKQGLHRDSQKHVGPFDIKIVDQFLANCGSCDKGFRCDGCVMPYEEAPINVASDQHIVIDWNLTKEEFDKLRKSLVFDLSSERVEHAGNTANITIHDCLNKFIGQYKIPEWFCQHCKDFKQATKMTTIADLPPTLMVHLSRFELNRYWHRISKAEVDFPVSGLDLTGFVEAGAEHDDKKILYDLEGVLQLSGSRGYSACIRNPGDNRFYHYTPSATYLLPAEDSDLAGLKSILCSGDACVLVYTRTKASTSS